MIKKVNGNNVNDFTDMPFGETEKVFSVSVQRGGEIKKLSTEIISKELVIEIIQNSQF